MNRKSLSCHFEVEYEDTPGEWDSNGYNFSSEIEAQEWIKSLKPTHWCYKPNKRIVKITKEVI